VKSATHLGLYAVAVLCLAVVRSGAQSPARLGLMAGATVPASEYASGKNVGYHIGLLLDVRVPMAPVGFRIDGTFNEIGYSANSTKQDIWATNANVLLKLPTGTMLVPYVIGGAGIYNSHRTLILGGHSSTDPGVNLGGGLRFEVGDLTTFVEARYHRVTGDAGIRILPITLGILF
jgi:hypothetical protein